MARVQLHDHAARLKTVIRYIFNPTCKDPLLAAANEAHVLLRHHFGVGTTHVPGKGLLLAMEASCHLLTKIGEVSRRSMPLKRCAEWVDYIQ